MADSSPRRMQDGPLQERYTITHKDGLPLPPHKRFFVLDLSDPDPRERAALLAFITEAERTGYEALAASLRAALPAPSPRID